MARFPWEYLFLGFNSANFHDLFDPLWVASLLLLVALALLYIVRTRQLRGHRPYLDLYEWLLWSGGITFLLVLIDALFAIDFLFVIATLVVGLGAMADARFRRYPPLLTAYQQRLARERYFSSRKYGRPEATIRSRRRRRR